MFCRVPREQHRRNSWKPGGFFEFFFTVKKQAYKCIGLYELGHDSNGKRPPHIPWYIWEILGALYALFIALYTFPIQKPKVGFSIKVSSSHVPCTQQPRSQTSDIAFRVRKEKERSISELIFDLRRARQAAGANVPGKWGRSGGEHCRSSGFHPWKTSQMHEKWWLMFSDLKTCDFFWTAEKM